VGGPGLRRKSKWLHVVLSPKEVAILWELLHCECIADERSFILRPEYEDPKQIDFEWSYERAKKFLNQLKAELWDHMYGDWGDLD
jgi:hypothetical protein